MNQIRRLIRGRTSWSFKREKKIGHIDQHIQSSNYSLKKQALTVTGTWKSIDLAFSPLHARIYFIFWSRDCTGQQWSSHHKLRSQIQSFTYKGPYICEFYCHASQLARIYIYSSR
jgi:hypothetical protein